MDYEKKYKEALERARKLQENSNGMILKKWLWNIFPELKESEDEKIRKAIIDYFDDANKADENPLQSYGIHTDKAIAWLKKQSEQKPSEQKHCNKVEPKFNVGDWCIDNEDGTIFQIVKVLDNTYTYKTNEGKEYSCTHYSLENDAHLWTIQDCKPGDVLVTDFEKNNMIVMYHSMCTIDTINVFCCLDNKFVCWNLGVFNVEDVKPATKEQRELLFQEMKEAGYEWLKETHQLKKIGKPYGQRKECLYCRFNYAGECKGSCAMKRSEQSHAEKVQPKFHEGDWVVSNLDGKARRISEVHFDEYNSYYVVDGKSVNLEEYDRLHHLWSIQDAKEGDVLVHNGCTFIFMGIKDGIVQAIEENILETVSFGEPYKDNDYCPATKEQRDLLFEKMKEADYVWDDNKKELKKI